MIIAAAVLMLVLLFCIWQNGRITVANIEYKSLLVPQALNGFTIAQVSDLHNRRFAGGPQQLIDILRAQSPDIIAVTGDLIDRYRPDIETAMEFINLAAAVAPVYFSPGNHEAKSGQYEALLPRLAAAGVHVLDDTAETVVANGGSFVIAGLRDPAFFGDHLGRTDKKTLAEREAALRRLVSANSKPLILLSHRPELFAMYARCGVTLALCGHAHGGQVRLPGIGGLYAPNQGIFPRYTSGLYRRGDTAMVISRGLGGRFTRLRVFNRPEVVVVKLRANQG